MTKPKSKVTDEGSGVTGPVPNPITGFEFAKGLHRLETFSAVGQGDLHRPETMSTTLPCSEKAEEDKVLPMSLLCLRLLSGALQVRWSTPGWVQQGLDRSAKRGLLLCH
jgi:hypothetical protein